MAGLRAVRLIAALVVVVLCAACGGGGSHALSDPDDLPPEVKAPLTDVSVCDLVPASTATATLDRPLRVVGLEYGPAAVPTLRCLLGDEFGVGELTVELAVGPVAHNVFVGAYGDRAGGDPEPIGHLGGAAYLRNEKDERSLHVYSHGSVLSLRLIRDPTQPVPRATFVGLARGAVDHLPPNPRLAPTTLGSKCGDITRAVVEPVLGAEPTRAVGIDGPDGSLMCSWSAFPGSVTVTVVVDSDRVHRYRDTVDAASSVEVSDIGEHGVTALSRVNRAGDLLLFDGDQAMALISVIPSAGYPDASIVTTPAEAALAAKVVESLMPPAD